MYVQYSDMSNHLKTVGARTLLGAGIQLQIRLHHRRLKSLRNSFTLARGSFRRNSHDESLAHNAPASISVNVGGPPAGGTQNGAAAVEQRTQY